MRGWVSAGLLNYGCGNVVKEDAKVGEAFVKKFAKAFAKAAVRFIWENLMR